MKHLPSPAVYLTPKFLQKFLKITKNKKDTLLWMSFSKAIKILLGRKLMVMPIAIVRMAVGQFLFCGQANGWNMYFKVQRFASQWVIKI